MIIVCKSIINTINELAMAFPHEPFHIFTLKSVTFLSGFIIIFLILFSYSTNLFVLLIYSLSKLAAAFPDSHGLTFILSLTMSFDLINFSLILFTAFPVYLPHLICPVFTYSLLFLYCYYHHIILHSVRQMGSTLVVGSFLLVHRLIPTEVGTI